MQIVTLSKRSVSHQKIIDYFECIANEHILINSFCRFNFNEIKARLRGGVEDYILCLESHSGDITGNLQSTFNSRTVSLLVLGTASTTDFDKQMKIMDTSEQIILDILSRIQKDAKDDSRNSPTRWLRGFDKNSVSYDAGGPLFINKYGYNAIITLPNHEPLCFRSEYWSL